VTSEAKQLLIVLLLSMATAVVAMTITKATLFKDFRGWSKKQSRLLGELMSCPFCMSFWISAAAVFYYKPRPVVSDIAGIDYVTSVLIIVCLSSFWCGLIFKAYSQMGVPEEPPDSDQQQAT